MVIMRRLFIIRKDLHLHAGKLAAMIGHCAECYWMNLIKSANRPFNDGPGTLVSFVIDDDVMQNYIQSIFTKTICEAKNLNHLMKVVEIAKEMGLKENVDYGFIDDVCKTDLTPEFVDEYGTPRCRVGIWFKPLSDEDSHKLSKKYQLYKD